jgi:hypothetical protein
VQSSIPDCWKVGLSEKKRSNNCWRLLEHIVGIRTIWRSSSDCWNEFQQPVMVYMFDCWKIPFQQYLAIVGTHCWNSVNPTKSVGLMERKSLFEHLGGFTEIVVTLCFHNVGNTFIYIVGNKTLTPYFSSLVTISTILLFCWKQLHWICWK